MLSHSEREKNNLLGPGILFLVTVLGVGLILYFLFSPLEYSLQTIETRHVRSLLSSVGVQTQNGFTPIQFWVNDRLIEISALCSGLVEFALLAGAILATNTASWKKRIIGIVVGVFLLYVFNLLRITITILQIAHTNMAFAEFTHDVLFRIVLILGFAFVYAGWLHFSRVRNWLFTHQIA